MLVSHSEEWCNLARFIVKDLAGEDIVERFMLVVKNHFMHIKKSQTDRYLSADAASTGQNSSRSVVLLSLSTPTVPSNGTIHSRTPIVP